MKSVSLLALCSALSFSAIAADVPAPVLPPLPVPGVSLGAPVLDASFPHGLSVVEFARVVLQDVLRQPFIFSDDFLLSKAQVGFSAKELKRTASEALLRDVLKEHGFTLTKAAGYYRVVRYDEKKALVDFWYKPRFRSVGYLSSIVRPLFSDGAFTYDRPITRPAAPSGPSAPTSGGSTKPADSGGSLYSMSTQSDVDSFLFRGSPADVDRLKAVLDRVDVAVPRVLVRALVLEVSGASTDAWGVSAVAKLLTSNLSVSLSGNTQGVAGSLTFKGPDFNAVAGVFGNQSNVSVLTSPSVFAEAGAQANLSVGSSVPVLGAIQYSGNGDQSRQSVEYRDTGVILRLTPKVYDEAISLDVTQEISDAVATTTGVAGSPTLLKRSISTTLNLSSGSYVVIGGLSSSKKSSASDFLPIFDWFKPGVGSSSVRSDTDVVIVLYVEKA